MPLLKNGMLQKHQKVVRKVARYTKYIYKTPTCNIAKDCVTCISLYTIPNDINFFHIDESTSTLGKTIIDVALLIMRKTGFLGIDALDVAIALAIVAICRKQRDSCVRSCDDKLKPHEVVTPHVSFSTLRNDRERKTP